MPIRIIAINYLVVNRELPNNNINHVNDKIVNSKKDIHDSDRGRVKYKLVVIWEKIMLTEKKSKQRCYLPLRFSKFNDLTILTVVDGCWLYFLIKMFTF